MGGVRDFRGVDFEETWAGLNVVVWLSLVCKMKEQAEAIIRQCYRLLNGDELPDVDLGEVAVIAGVRAYPSRIKCAGLPWNALKEALGSNLGED